MSNRWIVPALALACALPWSGAAAAPQVLGLVASNGVATPLDCSGPECDAHFSAFCLQQARDAPSHGDAYAVAPGGAVTLVVSTADGRSLRLPGEGTLRFTALIGFTSVRIALPRLALADLESRLGATKVAVEIGPGVSLLPIERRGDPDPQTAAEIALATGPMRAAAALAFEAPGRAADAARLTGLLINALPERGLEDRALRDGLWDSTVGADAVAALTPPGLRAGRNIYETCRISVESRSMFTMRNCLELRHADLMARTNHEFWEATGGS